MACYPFRKTLLARPVATWRHAAHRGAKKQSPLTHVRRVKQQALDAGGLCHEACGCLTTFGTHLVLLQDSLDLSRGHTHNRRVCQCLPQLSPMAGVQRVTRRRPCSISSFMSPFRTVTE